MKQILFVYTLLTFFPAVTMASLDLTEGGIRVVFNSTDKAQVLRIKNSGQQRFLIQSRVLESPDRPLSGSFLVTPPLFTLQPDSRQQLRIIALGRKLPNDRESLFYLSIMTIPSRQESETAESMLSMEMQFGLKLFYRPVSLRDGLKASSLQISAQAKGVLIENLPLFSELGLFKTK